MKKFTKKEEYGLTIDQIHEAIQATKLGGDGWQIARELKLSFCQLIRLLHIEGDGMLPNYRKYTKVYTNWTDPKKIELKRLYDEGYDDDDIARLMTVTSHIAVSKQRSNLNKNSNDLRFYDKMGDYVRTTLKTRKSSFSSQHLGTNVIPFLDADTTLESKPIQQAESILKPRYEDYMVVGISRSDYLPVEKDFETLVQQLKTKLNWRSVCRRIINPTELYMCEVNHKQIYVKQVSVDPNSGLVQLAIYQVIS
jgi:hypothetical protein